MAAASQKKKSYFGVLVTFTFVICIFDIMFVWNAVEQEMLASDFSFLGIDQRREHQQKSQQQKKRHSLEKVITSNMTIHPEKVHVTRILRKAGVSISEDLLSRLPHSSDIVSQYGPRPILYNFESCSAFRNSTPAPQRYIGIAGMFNTGTNLLSDLMALNCVIRERAVGGGMRFQVPWGKHNPPEGYRLNHVAMAGGTGINQTAVLPAVLIKDPYHWSVSQCRHKYMTQWEHDPHHCPNIVSWKNGKPPAIRVKFAKGWKTYHSFVGMWNEWYQEYLRQASAYPLVYVRFEDLLFHTEYVVNELCLCAGGVRRKKSLQYLEESAKDNVSHPGATGLVEALLRYGDLAKRLEGWTKQDWEYARDNLNQTLLDIFGYTRPPWP